MNINDLVEIISGQLLTLNGDRSKKIEDVYICDLLSWVLSHANKSSAWITVLTNVNVPAVALMVEAACVIITEDIKVEELTLRRANENGVILISTKLNSFEVSKRIIESKLL